MRDGEEKDDACARLPHVDDDEMKKRRMTW
jgi:hypothetical protein